MDGGSNDSTVQHLRSKTRVIEDWGFGGNPPGIEHFPEWGFDGSSTNQAGGADSDCVLKPVRWVRDPIRGTHNFLVLCEVYNGDGKTPHETNTRAALRGVLDEGAKKHEPWFGFEQEYTLYKGRSPLGWPEIGSPSRTQGPFYCGVGADEVAGREIVEAHLKACLEAEIMIYGVNAEVMLGQWEFQVGHRGFREETGDPLLVSDHLLLARWLLYRLGENYGITAKLDCKPEKGDWNGAGMHTNFSTKWMRSDRAGPTGMIAIKEAIDKLESRHSEHIADYGEGLEARLTGEHETCNISEFRAGPADRGASIRIPRHVYETGRGYLEDRRPGANADPYRVCAMILQTVCL